MKPMPYMLDVCAGLKGASQAMSLRGWSVITIDISPKLGCDIVTDVRNWIYTGEIPDLIWCSPPCTEFSRESMPWCKTGMQPDLSIVKACIQIIEKVKPRFWIIENTRGAIKYFKPLLGDFRYHRGPFYLWGFFPMPGKVNTRSWRKKESFSSSKDDERGKIPFTLSNSIAEAIELQGCF